jgi:hypothetical protein
MNLTFERLGALLSKPVSDADIRELIAGRELERSAHQGFVEIVDVGVSLMFKEAPWVVESDYVDPSALYLSAIHFHRQGHEGYAQYSGALPGGVRFDDDSSELRSKLGEPLSTGGGGMSKVLRQAIPRWSKYRSERDGIVIHFQFDAQDRLELVTLMAYKPQGE